MKFQALVFILLLLLLSACAPQTAIVTLPIQTSIQPTVSSTSTSQPTKAIQPTSMSQLTRTPNPSPSATPAFDVASIVIRTPSPPEQCPAPANVPLPKFSGEGNTFDGYSSPSNEEILNYLNAGGDPTKLIISLHQSWRREEVFMSNEIVKDVTGDGVPEILITPSHFYIFGCQEGKYELLLTQINDSITMNSTLSQLVTIQDLNADGTPEVILALYGCGGMSAGQCLDVYVYEWNGQQFFTLNPNRSINGKDLSMYGAYSGSWAPNVGIKDIDNNGTKELILTGGIPNAWYDFYFSQYPWRDQSDTYMWDGQQFAFYRREFSPPEYRYQAVQDGDQAMLFQEYEKALVAYQNAIFNDKLLGWSQAHREYYTLMHKYTWSSVFQATLIPPDPPEIPPDDPQEYPNLAAYARYRIMLLHIVQEHITEAKTVYDTLQEKFPEGKTGHEFALMAQAFWDEYQIHPDIQSACQKAIEFASTHKKILKYLGSDYHNPDQDLIYQPLDACSFK